MYATEWNCHPNHLQMNQSAWIAGGLDSIKCVFRWCTSITRPLHITRASYKCLDVSYPRQRNCLFNNHIKKAAQSAGIHLKIYCIYPSATPRDILFIFQSAVYTFLCPQIFYGACIYIGVMVHHAVTAKFLLFCECTGKIKTIPYKPCVCLRDLVYSYQEYFGSIYWFTKAILNKIVSHDFPILIYPKRDVWYPKTRLFGCNGLQSTYVASSINSG